MVLFGRIVRDTKVCGEQPIEEAYTVAAVSGLTLIIGATVAYANPGPSLLVWYGPVCLYDSGIQF